MNIAVCVKQIPDPAMPGELDPETKTLKREGKLILDESDSLRRRDGAPARRQGRRGRGHARLDGAERRGVGAAHRPRDGRGQGDPRLRPGPPGLRRADDGQGARQGRRARRRGRPRAHRDRVDRRLHRHHPRAGRRAARLAVAHVRQAHRDRATARSRSSARPKPGYDIVEASLPAVVSVTAGVVEPRYPSFKGIMAAKNKPVDKVKAADLGLSEDEVGWKGARQEIKSVEAAPERQAGEKIEDEGDAHERDRRLPRAAQGHLGGHCRCAFRRYGCSPRPRMASRPRRRSSC